MKKYDEYDNAALQDHLNDINRSYPNGFDPARGEMEAFRFVDGHTEVNDLRIWALAELVGETSLPSGNTPDDVERRQLLQGCIKTLGQMGVERFRPSETDPATDKFKQLVELNGDVSDFKKTPEGDYRLSDRHLRVIQSGLYALARDTQDPQANFTAGRHSYVMAQMTPDKDARLEYLTKSRDCLQNAPENPFAQGLLQKAQAELQAAALPIPGKLDDDDFGNMRKRSLRESLAKAGRPQVTIAEDPPKVEHDRSKPPLPRPFSHTNDRDRSR